MNDDQLWLNDRWYDRSASERLRQLALWSPRPILIASDSGLPIRHEDEAVRELQGFADEGLISLWSHEGAESYPASVGTVLTRSSVQIISETTYSQMVSYVDSRLEGSAAEISQLGFEDAEGMLLEQVVLRRRFFSQATLFALRAGGLGDELGHQELYKVTTSVGDTLVELFRKLRMPSLSTLHLDDYFALRSRAQQVFPGIMEELRSAIEHVGGPTRVTSTEAVDVLATRYQSEILAALRRLNTLSGRDSVSHYEGGSFAGLEARLALLRGDRGLAQRDAWMNADDGDAIRAFALFLFDWKSGGIGEWP